MGICLYYIKNENYTKKILLTACQKFPSYANIDLTPRNWWDAKSNSLRLCGVSPRIAKSFSNLPPPTACDVRRPKQLASTAFVLHNQGRRRSKYETQLRRTAWSHHRSVTDGIRHGSSHSSPILQFRPCARTQRKNHERHVTSTFTSTWRQDAVIVVGLPCPMNPSDANFVRWASQKLAPIKPSERWFSVRYVIRRR